MVKKYIRIVVINLIVLFGLIFIINWTCGVYLKSTRSERWSLPNYEGNVEYAKKIFSDYNKVKHQYSPFVGWRTRSFKGPTTNINENGIRVTSQNQANKESKSIHFFGGSTMWGEGSPDSLTIPSLFMQGKYTTKPNANSINCL